MYQPPHILSVCVFYVAVRTTVLPRHGCYRTTLWIFWGLAGWKLRLSPLRLFYVQLYLSQTSHLIYITSLHVCPSVYSTWCAPGGHPSNYGCVLIKITANTINIFFYKLLILQFRAKIGLMEALTLQLQVGSPSSMDKCTFVQLLLHFESFYAIKGIFYNNLSKRNAQWINHCFE